MIGVRVEFEVEFAYLAFYSFMQYVVYFEFKEIVLA